MAPYSSAGCPNLGLPLAKESLLSLSIDTREPLLSGIDCSKSVMFMKESLDLL